MYPRSGVGWIARGHLQRKFSEVDRRNFVYRRARKYPEAKAILMRSHGMFSVGPNLTVAYNLADLVEAKGQIALFSSRIPE